MVHSSPPRIPAMLIDGYAQAAEMKIISMSNHCLAMRNFAAVLGIVNGIFAGSGVRRVIADARLPVSCPDVPAS